MSASASERSEPRCIYFKFMPELQYTRYGELAGALQEVGYMAEYTLV